MGMPLPSHTYWTRDLVLALPDDGNRYELAYGEPTEPLPRIARDQLRWHPSGASAPCLIDLAAVFQD
jgi:hypothetical protein